ncbi:mismatch repair ATPase MSH1 ASCRUDRAFT_38830 [Ascoidea rubescens DSM 1968]|uniref:DNA mismatch repair proteins mutS family domain-containing protein n=1 Tax=Ascoidea rubescens DSM 1968 TaxID=1344418 RepID=A0A1D2VAI8_9ASCO|nr:hypothetical protein ASCRUDRAFT_38830 [Ascoidea rubescens DSM 1968]ODV58706.1 hypothetical protein ASCRUDRAFT_38830 [Ascoidea rubescens DSM 1968]
MEEQKELDSSKQELLACEIQELVFNTKNVNDSASAYQPNEKNDAQIPDDRTVYSSENTTNLRYSATLQSIRDMMDEHPDKIVLTEVGSFYEIYFESAEEYASILNLKLASKTHSVKDKITDKVVKVEKVALSGFPAFTLNKYLDILVNELNKTVVLVNQYITDINLSRNTNIKTINRKIYRIITPGTIIDESLIKKDENNYICAIKLPSETTFNKNDISPTTKIGLAWCDISTSKFFFEETDFGNLINELERINPKEIIINSKIEQFKIASGKVFLNDLNNLNRYNISYFDTHKHVKDVSNYYSMFELSSTNDDSIAFIFKDVKQNLKYASTILLSYIRYHFPIDYEFNLSKPIEQIPDKYLLIDSRARKSLELKETYRDQKVLGSLFFTIRKTITPSGSRLLSDWISSPLCNKKMIKKRLNLVECFYKRNLLLDSILPILRKYGRTDISRILVNLTFFSNGLDGKVLKSLIDDIQIPENLVELIEEIIDVDSLIKTKQIEEKNQNDSFIEETDNYIENENESENKIQNDIETENEYSNLQTGLEAKLGKNDNGDQFSNLLWIIKPNFKNEKLSKLSELHEKLKLMLNKKDELFFKYSNLKHNYENIKKIEIKIEEDLPIVLMVFKNRKISTSSLEFELTKKEFKMEHLVKDFKLTKWFTTEEWSNIGIKIIKIVKDIKMEEKLILLEIRKEVLLKSEDLKRCSYIIDEIDILISFARLAKEFGLIKPEIVNENVFDIRRGRHISVEASLQKKSIEFISNDCFLDTKLGSLGYIISGPNMGGKSTYLRQIAIICIMAQIGSFVSADYAKIGLVDKIFTRIGSADDISNNQSTFMVEMRETSLSLNYSTPRSLIILDEIGRGTTTNEGISIAYGILKYLVNIKKCRFLFASHFVNEIDYLIKKDLNNKERIQESLEFKHTNYVQNDNGKGYYDRELKDGICKYSYADTVAQDAGMPEYVIEISKEAYKTLESQRADQIT